MQRIPRSPRRARLAARQPGKGAAQPIGHVVRMTREPEPEIIAAIGSKLGRDKAVLRNEVAGPLAPFRHMPGACGVEEDDGLACKRATLRGSERKNVNARPPRRISRRDIHARERIAQARAIHVYGNPMRTNQLGQLTKLVRPIERACLCGLRHREYGTRDVVRCGPIALERFAQLRRRDLSCLAGNGDELYAAAEKLRRAAFVGGDMRVLVTEHSAPGRRQMGDGKRIGGRARCDEKNGDLALEHLCKTALDFFRPRIPSVGQHLAVICARDCRKDFRCDPGRIIARKVH
jgi:hypothetical protein